MFSDYKSDREFSKFTSDINHLIADTYPGWTLHNMIINRSDDPTPVAEIRLILKPSELYVNVPIEEAKPGKQNEAI